MKAGHEYKSGDDQQLQSRTRKHYDSFPFDFMTPDDESAIAEMQPRPFHKFVKEFVKQGALVGEVGCGPGRGTLYLCQKKVDVIAVDLSQSSLSLAKRRAPSAAYVSATNLALPFPEECFEIVVSDGVIHHTPDAYASFRENVRVLKEGGALYLGVYNRHRYYFYIYTYVGPLIRWVERYKIGRVFLHATLIPLYYLIHLVKSGGTRTFRGAVNFFYDYIITPRASFHSYEEVQSWGREEGLSLVRYDKSLGNVHVFYFTKPQSSQ